MTTTTVTPYEVPLDPNPQTFQIALSGVTYSITLWWNSQSGFWNISIADANNAPILDSIPLVANVDLFGPFAYLNFGGQLVCQTDHNPNLPPTYDNLGTVSHLYFVVTTTNAAPVVAQQNVVYGDTGTGGSGGTGGTGGTGGGSGGGGRVGIGTPPRGRGTV